MSNPTLRIATAPKRNSRHWKQGTITWRELLRWVENVDDVKESGGYVLGELRLTTTQHRKPDKTPDGPLCTGLHRKKSAVVSRDALTLDADYARSDLPDQLDIAHGWASLIHTTHSSKPDAPRYRLVILTSRAVTPGEYRRLAGAVMDKLGADQFDPGSDQPERYMFRPAASRPEWFQSWVIDGDPLDVDALLAELPPEDEPEKERSVDASRPPTAEHLQRAQELLAACAEQLAATPEGERNNTLVALLPTLYRFVLGGCLTEDEVDEAMRDAATRAGIEDEYDATSWSAWSYAEKDGPDRPETAADVFGAIPLDDLFDATPTLRAIRQAAHSRLVGAPSLLCYVLARVLADTSPSTTLPPTIGGRASLNLGFAIVGGSGAGKSALLSVSRGLLGLIGHEQEDIERNVGSGEGLVAQFLAWDKTAKALVPIDDPRRILMVDEIDQLGATQHRSGATIAPTLRSALTGGPLGQANATVERNRHVRANSYRLVMLLGVQPTRSHTLLEDADAGTPQRLVWVPAIDPTIPDEDVEWPDSLDWAPPSELHGDVDYPAHIKAEIRAARRSQMKEGSDPLKGHQLLTRLKVSAALALLHGEVKVTDQWWELAGQILDMSTTVQAECRKVLAAEAITARRSQGRMDGIRQEGAAEYRNERVVMAASAIWRKVQKHANGVNDGNDQKHEPDRGCSTRCFGRAVKDYADRDELRAPAVQHAVASDWIVEQDGHWFTGESRPA